MTDNTRVSDGNSAAAPRTHSDNFDRTELFNSFGKTGREQDSTDTTRSTKDDVSSVSSDKQQLNRTDATDTNNLQTNENDKQNGDRNSDANNLRTNENEKQNGDRKNDANTPGEKKDGDSLNVPNVFEELGLTRGLANQTNAIQSSEGNGIEVGTPIKGAEQQFPQLTFFDSARASISARSDASPRNRGREQQPGSLRQKPGDRIENKQKVEIAKPQNGLQVENIGSSNEFANKVQKQIDSLTPATRAALEKNGVEVVTTDKLTSVRPDLKGKEPYNQPGLTYDNLKSFYLPNSKSVVIAENRQDRAGNNVSKEPVEGVVKHEVGHALDAALGNFSQKPEFVEAHQKDVANLNGFEKGLFNYLVGSKDGDGKKEAFAEVWGALNGSSSNPAESKMILQKFPNVAKLIKEQLPQHIKK